MKTKEFVVTYTDLMYVFNVSHEGISNMVEAGMPKLARGEYDLIECARWKIQQLADQLEVARTSGDEKLHGLKMQGQRISNKANEIKLRKMLGELVDLQAARLAWLNETTIFRKALSAMVFKLAAALDNADTKTKRLQAITAEVHAVMEMIGDIKLETEINIEELENVDADDSAVG